MNSDQVGLAMLATAIVLKLIALGLEIWSERRQPNG